MCLKHMLASYRFDERDDSFIRDPVKMRGSWLIVTQVSTVGSRSIVVPNLSKLRSRSYNRGLLEELPSI